MGFGAVGGGGGEEGNRRMEKEATSIREKNEFSKGQEGDLGPNSATC